ncbi:MAG TPA: MFS transporter [Lautropia sp.]|nr:MFS transporter [Lautropia sp.]
MNTARDTVLVLAPVTPPDPGRWRALAVLAAAMLLIAIDNTVLNLALPALARDLAPTATQLLWIVDVYSLVLAGLLVTAGTLGDRWGRKRLLLAGVTLFGIASVLAALAPTAEMLIAARVLLGVGGALIMPSTLSLLRNTFHDARERTLAIGIWGATASAGAGLGPIVGGILLQWFSWPAVFLINVPVMLMVLLLGVLWLRESRDPHPGQWDAVSALLSGAGLVALVWGIKEASSHGLLTPGSLLPLVGAVVLFTIFVVRQGQLVTPLIDVQLFRNRVFSTAVVCTMLALFGLAGLLFFASLLLQIVLGYSPLESGLRLLPAVIGSALAAPLVGPIVRRFGLRGPIAGGLALGAISLLAVGLLGAETPFPPLALAFAGVGMGVGLAMTASSDAIITAAPPARAGAAAAISETGYELGTALGVAVLGSVMNVAYQGGFPMLDGVPEDALVAARSSLPAAVEAAAALGGSAGDALLAASQAAFLSGLMLTTGIGGAIMLLAAGAAWRLLPRRAPMVVSGGHGH